MNRTLHHRSNGGHAATPMAGFGDAAQSALAGIQGVAGSIREGAGQLGTAVCNAAETGWKQSKAMKKSLDGAVRARPMTAIAIAAGAGMLVGLMWRRRR